MKFVFSFVFMVLLSFTWVKADITFGVVPQQSPLQLFKIWQPVANYLSEALGEKVHFKTEKSIVKFAKKLYSGAYDMAYMNPLHFVLLNQKRPYEALVRSDKSIRGILVMRKQDSLQRLKDKNIKILFPAPHAFAATVLMKYDLAEKYGVTLEVLENSKYVNSHDSVYKGVARGVGDIGGGIERTFNYKHNRGLQRKLHIVHRSIGYPTHPFAVRTTLSKSQKQKLMQALLNMPKALLKQLNIKSLKAVDANEYQQVDALAKRLKITAEF